ncbi:hypothetical protein ACFQY5_33250 [Paeniroseomonas aquatica]|uniref:hypothetical protein n=1 Tax=Paeniroseomonas aquatica TaxID=373043 RepID=UPI0036115967
MKDTMQSANTRLCRLPLVSRPLLALSARMRRGYTPVMAMRLLRQIVFLVTLGAFLTAGVTQAVPRAVAPPPSMAMMTMDIASTGTQVPCQEKIPDCMLDLGCIFMVGLPLPSMSAVTQLSLSSVTYWMTSVVHTGLSRKPALNPPISLV